MGRVMLHASAALAGDKAQPSAWLQIASMICYRRATALNQTKPETGVVRRVISSAFGLE